MIILCIEICKFSQHFKSFYTSLFDCIHLHFLILFPVTLDMCLYRMNNKDMYFFFIIDNSELQ